jgi:hypothetical protein
MPAKFSFRVILNEVKNPSGFTSHSSCSDAPTGFFAALRMTGFVSFTGLERFWRPKKEPAGGGGFESVGA